LGEKFGQIVLYCNLEKNKIRHFCEKKSPKFSELTQIGEKQIAENEGYIHKIERNTGKLNYVPI
jgi:hypothetical protein